MGKILIIDDDVAGCRTLQMHLRAEGHEVVLAYSVEAGLQQLQQTPQQLIILDIRMPGLSGLEGLPLLKRQQPGINIIMITAFHDMESTIKAMQQGADDFIHKPLDLDELDTAIAKCLSQEANSEGLTIEQTRGGSANELTMVGCSRAMKEVFKTIGMVAKSQATVLITGESGTGKELAAQAIHRASGQAHGPFVVVNCAAVVDTLLESDMFGHEKGAFTGAVSRQVGKFELAHNGTIFLDEVGEMSALMQAKLLRVLQYKEYMPLGAKLSKKTDTRIIAATNIDLSARVAEGKFREDLYYRLSVVNIELPPLREHKEDLPGLVQTMLGRINRSLDRVITRVDNEVMDAFAAYDWPGNVRELENVLMKTAALSTSDSLSIGVMPPEIIQAASGFCGSKAAATDSGLRSLAELEREHVRYVLSACDWHKGRACEILQVSRPRLRRLIREYQLTPPTQPAAD